ncbi:MAG: ferrous iron transport protein A [Victivallales bacterium]|nr:ferrous iron transport protein A [Victivallales bacterium]
MSTIGNAGIGETHVIRKITGDDRARQHLAELGFVVGEEIALVNKAQDDVVLKVKGTSIAIGASLAKCILI